MRLNPGQQVSAWLLLLALAQAWFSACMVDVGSPADPDVAVSEEPVLFGEDDRLDIGAFAAGSRERRWADATAILLNGGVTCSGGNCDIDWTYEEARHHAPICEDQPFWLQPMSATAFCSAVLVGPRLFATAGHCTNEIMRFNCTNMKVVFGFQAEGTFPNLSVPESDVYTCSKVVGYSSFPDYALIEVDRPVSRRIPMWVRRSNQPATGTAVTAIGYPSALPLKIDQGGTVRSVSTEVISANVDVSENSSGGPLIETSTGVVAGVMAQAPDSTFVISGQGTPDECLLWNYCEDTGCSAGFATATRTTLFHSQVPLHPAGIAVSVLM